jgi:uncharacterized Ntn-hydrolase superfamily protein
MGNPRAAAFTGASALDHAGHRVGDNYAIQGNILLGPEILDSMEFNFQNTPGPLAVKLMAALQGANVPGADTRCLDEGTSSKSAFLRVFKPDDEEDNPYLEINVQLTPDGIEPIDSVQVIFDEWYTTVSVQNIVEGEVNVFPNPADDSFFIEYENFEGKSIQFIGLDGKVLLEQKLNSIKTEVSITKIGVSGMVLYKLVNEKGLHIQSGKLILN